MKFAMNSLKLKNSLIMIAVMVPLIVGFMAYDLNRQTSSMREAITKGHYPGADRGRNDRQDFIRCPGEGAVDRGAAVR